VSELPKGWVVTMIGDILQPQSDGKLIHQGWSPQCHAFPAGENEWGVLKTTAIQDGFFLDIHNKKLPDDKEAKSRIEVKNGDLLMTNAGPRIRCGVTTLVKTTRNKLMLSGKMYRMRFDETCIHPSYVEACFRSEAVTKEIDSRKTGMSESGLNLTQERFLTVPIILCPYKEQVRIANKLDSMLAKVDAAQARLDKIPNILKRFRQSVLAAATSGELTKEWRGTEELSNWQEKKLIDVITSKPRNGTSPKGVAYVTPIRNLTLGAITSGFFKPDKFKYVDLDVALDSYLWIKNGDLLIQRANSLEYVGISALYTGEDNKFIYPDLIMKCRANEEIIREYLFYSVSCERVREYFRENATGTAGNMPKINQGVVSNAPIFLPPLAEQKEIVRRVESLFTMADTVEKQFKETKTRTNRLTQSILAKAFRGELVEQVSNDEPASQILEHIKQQQLNSPKTAKQIRNTKKKDKPEVAVIAKAIESSQPQSEILNLLQKSNRELTAQQIMTKLTEQTFEQVDVLFTELKRLLDSNVIAKVGVGEGCTFKVVKK
jgi:type I restriction enzyme S subunit